MAVIPILNNNLKGLYNFHMDYLSVSYWPKAASHKLLQRYCMSQLDLFKPVGREFESRPTHQALLSLASAGLFYSLRYPSKITNKGIF